MRLCVIFVVFLSFTTYGKSSGQEQTVTLKLNQVSYYELFDAIRLQTGLRFLYNADQMKQMSVLDVNVKNKKVCDVLKDVLTGTPLTYVYDKEVIMLIKRTDAQAQQQKTIQIHGLVTDQKKYPLPGVTIMVKGLTVGTATDKDGKYRFTVPQMDNLTLVFSFIGMVPVEVKYAGKDTINVVMKEEVSTLDEVQIVATGYQNVNRKDMVGSYQTMKAEDFMMPAYASADQMLQGKIAGMVVMNTSGRVGTSPKIQIRGTSTLLGNSSPLWVVDGVIQPDPIKLVGNAQLRTSLEDVIGNQISWLNPQDIATITVLKDASATAIYGSRASSGVIVVTTKRGKIDRLTVNYAGNFSTTNRPNYDQFNVMNSQERMNFSDEASAAGTYYLNEPYEDFNTYEGVQKLFYNGKLNQSEFLSRKASLESMNTDWFKLLTRRAFSQNHNLSVSGGAEKFTYSVSVGYNKSQGQEIGNSQERFTGRVALNANLRKNVDLNVTVSGDRTEVSNFNGVNPFDYAINTSRAIPAFDEKGNLAYYQQNNGYSLTNQVIKTLGYNIINERDNSGAKVRNSSIVASLDLKWGITSWLEYQFTGGYNQQIKMAESYHGEKTYFIANAFRGYDFGSAAVGSAPFKAAQLPFGGDLYTIDVNNASYNVQNKLLISKSFNENNRLNVMLGMEVRSSRLLAHYNTVWGYSPERGKTLMKPTPLKNLVPMGTASPPYQEWGVLEALYSNLNGGWKNEDKTDNFFSWFGTFAYSLKNRYVFNFSIRNDQSNRFGQDVNKKIAPTYSFGLSWNVAEELFVQEQQDWLNMLKFRATYGIQGNAVDKNPELVLSRDKSAQYFNEYYSTISSIPNPYLKWEKTKTWNFGVDLELFRFFNATAEYYTRSSNAFVTQAIPYEYGKSTMDVNGGKIRNSGLEFTVAFTPINKKDMALSIALNSSKNWNETGKPVTVLQFFDYTSGTTSKIVREGYPIGGIWSYSFAGLSPKDGRPLFNNIDVPEKERNKAVDPLTYLTYSGSTIPTFTGGLNLGFRYKSFDIGADFALLLGAKKRLVSPFKSTNYGTKIPDPTINLSRDLLNRWKKPGDELKTKIPALVTGDVNQSTLPDERKAYWTDMWDLSDERVVDASFLRCTQINLTYRMNSELCKQLGFKSLSMSAIVNNVFVIASDRFDGFDPELGDRVLPRQFSLGINVGF